jgi:heterodisulfide reductase subunit C
MPNVFKEPLEPSSSLAERLAGLTSVAACYQCKKCSSGCPLTFAMDFYPDQVIRLALLGQEDTVLSCRTIWVCSSCETCTTRCPNQIDIAGVMDWLKEEALRRGLASPQPEVTRFHQTFLDTVRLAGGRLSAAVAPWPNSAPAPWPTTCAWPGNWPGAAVWCPACPGVLSTPRNSRTSLIKRTPPNHRKSRESQLLPGLFPGGNRH